MSEKFLVAIDGSDHGWKAVDLAADFAKAADAELILLHVVPREPIPEALGRIAQTEHVPVDEERARYRYSKALGDKITSEAETRARTSGVNRVVTRVAEGSPANEIVAVAEASGVGMIFLGSRGLSDVKGLLMGSVSHKVMHLAPCTCVAVR